MCIRDSIKIDACCQLTVNQLLLFTPRKLHAEKEADEAYLRAEGAEAANSQDVTNKYAEKTKGFQVTHILNTLPTIGQKPSSERLERLENLHIYRNG